MRAQRTMPGESGQHWPVFGRRVAWRAGQCWCSRTLLGQPTLVLIAVVDDGGIWKTFVGGGANAGF